MAVGEELGVGYVTLTVSTKGMGREITKEFKQAEVKARDTGQRMGREVSKGFDSTVDLDDLATKVRHAEQRATAEIERATTAQARAKEKLREAQARVTEETTRGAAAQAAAVEKATARQQKAVGRVTLEQRRLAAARQKAENAARAQQTAEDALQATLADSADDAAAIAKAQAAVDRAREKAADTGLAVATAEQKLADARRDATAADTALTRAAGESVKVRKALTDAVDDAQRKYDTASAAARWAADAENSLQKELRETSLAYQRAADAAERGGKNAERQYRSGWRGLAARLGAQVSDAVGDALGRVKPVATGAVHGKLYAAAFERGAGRITIPAPNMSGFSAVTGMVSKLSGLRAVGDLGTTVSHVFGQLDRLSVAAANAGLKIGGLSSVALGAVGSLLAMGSGLKTIAGASLALPGILAGVIGGVVVMNVALKDFANVLPGVTADYTALQQTISGNFWSRAAGPIEDAAYRLLPVLRTGLAAVSYEFGGWAVAIASVVGSAQGLEWVRQIMDNLRITADGMGDGIGAAANGLLQLTAVGSAYLPRLGGAFNSLAYSFENFVQVNTANGNIFRWIDTGVQEMRNLGSAIGGVFGILGGLQQASVAAGGPEGFGHLASGVQAVNQALKGPMWQGALTAMFKGAYTSLSFISKGISEMLPGLAALMPTLGQVMALSGETIGALISSLGDLFAHPAVQGGLVSFFTAVRDATTLLAPSAGLLGEVFGTLATMAGQLFFAVSGTLDAALKALAPGLMDVAQGASDLVPALSQIVQAIISGMGPSVSFLGGVLGGLVSIIAGVFTWLSQFQGALHALGLAAGFVVVPIVALGVALSIGAKIAALSRALMLVTAAKKLWAAATWVATTAMRALNLVLRMNPIGLVITAIMGLVAGLVIAYQRIGWFKDFVNAAWTSIKMVAFAVWNGIKAVVLGFANWLVTVAWPLIQAAIAGIGRFFTWLWQVAVVPAWNAIRAVISGFVNWFMVSVVPVLQGVVRALGNVFTWLLNFVIRPVWTGIKIAIAVVAAIIMTIMQGVVAVVRHVLAPAFTWLLNNIIRPVWQAIGAVLSGAWNAVIKPVFNAMKGGLQALGGKFSAVKDWIARTWSNLRLALYQGWLHILSMTLVPMRRGLQVLGEKFQSVKNWIARTWSNMRLALYLGWLHILSMTLIPLRRGLQVLGEKFQSVKAWIGRIWQGLRTLLYDGYVAIRNRTIEPLKSALSGLRDRFSNVKARIGDIWQGLRTLLYNGFVSIRDRTLNPLRAAAWKVKDTFDNVKEGIRKSWDGLKSAVKEPVKFVVETVVNNGLISNFNKVAKQFGIKEMPTLNLPAGFRKGGYTGNRRKDEVAGVVHGRENVINAESSASVERRAPGFLERLNREGAKALPPSMLRQQPRDPDAETPHNVYPAGGKGRNGLHFGGQRPIWGPLQDAIRRTGELQVRSIGRGFPVRQAAKDLSKASNIDVKMGSIGRNVVPVQAVNSLPDMPGWVAGYYQTGTGVRLRRGSVGSAESRLTLTRHELGHAMGLQHAMNVGARSMMNYDNMYKHHSITGADVNALAAIWGGKGEPVAGAGGAGGDDGPGLLSRLIEAIGFDKLLGKITGGPFVVDIMKGVANSIWEGFKSWAGDILNPFDGGGDANDQNVDISKAIEKWRPNVIAALKREGLPSNKTWQDAWLRQIRTESNGDPNAVQGGYVDANTGGNEAVGLVQVAKSTFESMRNPSLPNNRKDPDANLSAGMRWAKHRYGIDRILDVIGHGRGYSIGDGTVGRSFAKAAMRPGYFSKANKGVWDDPIGTTQVLRPGMNTIYNGTGSTEFFQRVEAPTAAAGGDGQTIIVKVEQRSADEDPTRFGRRVGEAIARQTIGVA